MPRFKVKHVKIEAFQFSYNNYIYDKNYPEWFLNNFELKKVTITKFVGRVDVKTKNGMVTLNDGDFVIKGQDEFYPCPPDVFHKKYEAL